MEQVIFGGWDNNLHPTDTEYNTLIGGFWWRTTETEVWKLVSTDGIIKNLRAKLNGPPGAGKKYTFTLMVNGAPTALTFDIEDTATSGSDMVHEIDVTGGDSVTIRCVPTGTPTARYAAWTSMFEGDTAKESLILGGTRGTFSNVDITYFHVMGSYGTPLTTENHFRQVAPTDGIIKNFYLWLSDVPGLAGDAYRLTLRKNGASQTLTITITTPDRTGNDLVNSFAVAAGDILTMMIEPLNSPSKTPFGQWGMTFVSDIDGESIVLGGTDDPPSVVDTNYNQPVSMTFGFWELVESNVYQLGQVCTLKKLYILLSAAPGAGNKYDFTLRKGGIDSNVVTTVSGAATTGNSGVLEDTVSNDHYVTLKAAPDDTPDVVDVYWGFVCEEREALGWEGKILGIESPGSVAKIMGIEIANISKIMGVEG